MNFMKRGITMKKLLLILALLVAIATLVACGDSIGTTETTTTGAIVEEGPEIVSTDDYTGTVNPAYNEMLAAGSSLGNIAKEYDYFGAAKSVVNSVNAKNPTNREWFLLDENGTKTAIDYSDALKLGVVAIDVNKKDGAKTEIVVKEIEAEVVPKFEKITAKSGEYLMIEFAANIPANFTVTITEKAGAAAATAIYTERQIPIETEKNGACKGLIKFTVPHTVNKTYYANLMLGSLCVATLPVEVIQGNYATNLCQLWMTGPWERVKDPKYIDNIIYEFYNCFPQILARFAVKGDEPREVKVYISDEDGVAWAAGTEVGIGLGWVNEQSTHRLNEIGFLSHELGHVAQQFAGTLNYGEHTCYDVNGDGVITDKRYKENGEWKDVIGDEYWESWFTEQMASYSGLRYYHWGIPEAVDLEKLTDAHNLYFDWSGYGNCGVFFAYVDWYFPTIDKNGNGKVDDGERGVIDAIYWLIKNSKKKLYDNPYDPETPFNKAIYEATGGKYKNFPEIYEDFKADFKSGAWVFTGFSDYKDNWLTENLEGVENQEYAVYKAVTPGNVTNNAVLQNDMTPDTVKLPAGENIAKGATIKRYSGKHANNEGVEALFDGDLSTHWRAMKSERSGAYDLMSLEHGFVLDLGEVKTFDTYTIVNAGITKPDAASLYTWEILVSTDGKNYTSIDYQENKPADVVTVDVGTQSARYIELRIYKPCSSSSGTLCIYEMAFVKTK